MTISLHELTSLHDPYLFDWLDLYEGSFPPEERVPVSGQLQPLRQKEHGLESHSRLFVALDEANRVTGMAQTFGLDPFCAVGLGYLAVAPDGRGKGTGTALYRALVDLLRAEKPLKFWIFDVEEPAEMRTAAARDYAEKRLRFYAKLGARAIPGVLFEWGSIRQRLMYHTFEEGVSMEEVLACAHQMVESSGGRWIYRT